MRIYKTATRPIKLDRQKVVDSIKRLKTFLIDNYYYTSHEHDPIGSQFIFVDRTILKGVDGVEFDVQINYVGKDSPHSKNIIVGGISGVIKFSGKPVIVVYINSDVTPKMFSRTYVFREVITNKITEVLEHELTHQADKFVEKFNTSGKYKTMPDANEVDLYSYYNNESEIRAYMRSIFDEIESFLPDVYKRKSVRQVIEMLNVYSPIWGSISKYLTDNNKNLILKGIYQAVSDWYEEHKN